MKKRGNAQIIRHNRKSQILNRQFLQASGFPWRVDFASSDGNPGTNDAAAYKLAAKPAMNTLAAFLQGLIGRVSRGQTAANRPREYLEEMVSLAQKETDSAGIAV